MVGELDRGEWPEGALRILLEVAESMMTATGERIALRRFARLALEATGADRCAIFMSDPRGNHRFIPAAGASRVGDPREQWRRFRDMEPIDLDDHPERRTAWRIGRAVILDDVEASDVVPDSYKAAWESKSLAFTSLRVGGEIYGLLAVDYVGRRHHFTAGETSLLSAVASAAGVALRNARLLEELQRSHEVDRRLAECAAAVQSGRSLNEILDLVVDRFTSLLPATVCSINLLSEDQERLRIVAFSGPPPSSRTIPLQDLPSEPVAWVRKTWLRDPMKPVLIHDVGSLHGMHHIIPPNIGPGMLVPLWDGEHVLGFVAAGRSRDDFTEDEVRVAVAFAGQAATAVSKACLHETLQTRLRTIEAFTKLNDVALRSSNLKRVIASLNRGVCKELGVECTQVAFAASSVAALLGTQGPNSLESALLREWRSSARAVRPHVVRDQVVVPIPMRGRPAGILWVRPLRDLEPATMDFLSAIAGCLGEVASKAQLRRTAERRSRELAVGAERERIARELHDTVGQTFFGIGLKLQDLIADVDDAGIVERLSEVRALAAQAVADVRSAVYALSFLHVRARGLVPSLRALTRQFMDATGIHAELRLEGRLPKLHEEAESALFRITHEALVNVDRHARATGVVVTLACTPSMVHLTIRDDGVGVDQRQVADWRSAAHFGMRTMARAAEEVGGRLSIQSAQPRGLTITAEMPLRAGKRRGT